MFIRVGAEGGTWRAGDEGREAWVVGPEAEVRAGNTHTGPSRGPLPGDPGRASCRAGQADTCCSLAHDNNLAELINPVVSVAAPGRSI